MCVSIQLYYVVSSLVVSCSVGVETRRYMYIYGITANSGGNTIMWQGLEVFISTVLIITSTFQAWSLDISVSSNGTDVPQCTTGSVPCLTLHYALLSLANSTCIAETSSVSIAIYYDQHLMVPASYAFQCQIALYITGAGEGPNTQTTARTLACDGATKERISIHNALSVYWENIHLYGCAGPDVYGLSYVDYNGCKIEESGGMIVESTSSVNITRSTLSYAQNILFQSLITITQANIHLRDSTFIGSSKGVATTLWALNSVLLLEGNLTFVNNSGVLGGALRLTESQVIVLGNVSAVFMNNYAQYGTALYVENVSCHFINTSQGFLDVTFTQSTAMGSSQSYIYMYITDPSTLNSTCLPQPSTYQLSYDTKYSLARTSPVNLSVTLADNTTVHVYPGKDIFVDVKITDYFQNAVSCETDLTMSYANTSFISCNDPQYQFELTCPFSLPQHPSSITLYSANNVNTTISIRAKAAPEAVGINIHFICDGVANSTVSFELQNCPSLYTTFNNVTGTCECVTPLNNEGTFVCSSGTACLANNQWIGWIASSTGAINKSVILPCYFPYCNLHPILSCPLTSSTNIFRLGDNPDSQCSSHRGGLLCMGCSDGYCFTHVPLRCVPRTSEDDALGLLLLAVLLHILQAIAVIFLLSLKPANVNLFNFAGLGPIYSASFFFSYIGRLQFTGLAQFSVLQGIVAAFTSIISPTLDIIGSLPLCLLPSFPSGSVYIIATRYLGLAVLLIVLIVYNTIFRLCPRLANHVHTSPIKSICLLVVWVYFVIIANSIDIIKYKRLHAVDEVRVALQPELVYFSGKHIYLGLTSILLILLFAVPLILLLLLSQFLWKCINLSRIKPFLDEFQSVFRDDARWFSSAYPILWIVIVSLLDITEDTFMIYVLILAAFCAVVCFVQPYKVKWLNIADAVLLVDMLMFTALFDHQLLQYQENVAITTLVYILVTLPIVYFCVIGTVAIASRLKCLKCKKTAEINISLEPLHDTMPAPPAVRRVVNVADFSNYREQLLI